LPFARKICKIHKRPVSIAEKPILYRAILYILLAAQCSLAQTYLTVKSKPGDGLYTLLRRYSLPTDMIAVAKFKDINKGGLRKNDQLLAGRNYQLPVLIVPYDGLSIASSLGLDDKKIVDQIDQYNFKTYQAGLRQQPYTRSKLLWLPLHLWTPSAEKPLDQSTPETATGKITPRSQALKGCLFYLDAGHGGPDPGAIGRRGKDFLYEDEYAYDITLRLAKRLAEYGAAVQMIVQDPNDGIRDSAILAYDTDERYCDNSAISHDLAQRLADRAAIVNRLHRRNKTRYRRQIALILHVDSRSNAQRIDIFYYYQHGVQESRVLAEILHNTIEKKYHAAQPGRGYDSSISTRNLHMLSALDPTTVYIELGNIRNPKDQERFIIPDNRQAVANWLCEGQLEAVRKMK